MPDQDKQSSSDSPLTPQRRPYVKPLLREFGSAAELTRNNISNNMNDTRFGSGTKT
jgi:hypothetical protein